MTSGASRLHPLPPRGSPPARGVRPVRFGPARSQRTPAPGVSVGRGQAVPDPCKREHGTTWPPDGTGRPECGHVGAGVGTSLLDISKEKAKIDLTLSARGVVGWRLM